MSYQIDSPNRPLLVTLQTWEKDSHELFDYETDRVRKTSFWVRSSVKLYREGATVVLRDFNDQPSEPNYEYIGKLIVDKDNIGVVRFEPPSPSETEKEAKVWLVIRDLPEKRYPLKQGDIINLGRFKLKVKQMVTKTPTSQETEKRISSIMATIDEKRKEALLSSGFQLDGSPIVDINVSDTRSSPPVVQGVRSGLVTCRICLSDDVEEDDPLISPCTCRGSIQYIHANCLKYWIQMKQNSIIPASVVNPNPLETESSSAPVDYHLIRQPACELCKTVLPDFIDVTQPSEECVNCQSEQNMTGRECEDMLEGDIKEKKDGESPSCDGTCDDDDDDSDEKMSGLDLSFSSPTPHQSRLQNEDGGQNGTVLSTAPVEGPALTGALAFLFSHREQELNSNQQPHEDNNEDSSPRFDVNVSMNMNQSPSQDQTQSDVVTDNQNNRHATFLDDGVTTGVDNNNNHLLNGFSASPVSFPLDPLPTQSSPPFSLHDLSNPSAPSVSFAPVLVSSTFPVPANTYNTLAGLTVNTLQNLTNRDPSPSPLSTHLPHSTSSMPSPSVCVSPLLPAQSPTLATRKVFLREPPTVAPPFLVLENLLGPSMAEQLAELEGGSVPINVSLRHGLHVIGLSEGKKQKVRLGRGHESDVRIPDVSISRVHAMLSVEPVSDDEQEDEEMEEEKTPARVADQQTDRQDQSSMPAASPYSSDSIQLTPLPPAAPSAYERPLPSPANSDHSSASTGLPSPLLSIPIPPLIRAQNFLDSTTKKKRNFSVFLEDNKSKFGTLVQIPLHGFSTLLVSPETLSLLNAPPSSEDNPQINKLRDLKQSDVISRHAKKPCVSSNFSLQVGRTLMSCLAPSVSIPCPSDADFHGASFVIAGGVSASTWSAIKRNLSNETGGSFPPAPLADFAANSSSLSAPAHNMVTSPFPFGTSSLATGLPNGVQRFLPNAFVAAHQNPLGANLHHFFPSFPQSSHSSQPPSATFPSPSAHPSITSNGASGVASSASLGQHFVLPPPSTIATSNLIQIMSDVNGASQSFFSILNSMQQQYQQQQAPVPFNVGESPVANNVSRLPNSDGSDLDVRGQAERGISPNSSDDVNQNSSNNHFNNSLSNNANAFPSAMNNSSLSSSSLYSSSSNFPNTTTVNALFSNAAESVSSSQAPAPLNGASRAVPSARTPVSSLSGDAPFRVAPPAFVWPFAAGLSWGGGGSTSSSPCAPPVSSSSPSLQLFPYIDNNAAVSAGSNNQQNAVHHPSTLTSPFSPIFSSSLFHNFHLNNQQQQQQHSQQQQQQPTLLSQMMRSSNNSNTDTNNNNNNSSNQSNPNIHHVNSMNNRSAEPGDFAHSVLPHHASMFAVNRVPSSLVLHSVPLQNRPSSSSALPSHNNNHQANATENDDLRFSSSVSLVAGDSPFRSPLLTDTAPNSVNPNNHNSQPVINMSAAASVVAPLSSVSPLRLPSLLSGVSSNALFPLPNVSSTSPVLLPQSLSTRQPSPVDLPVAEGFSQVLHALNTADAAGDDDFSEGNIAATAPVSSSVLAAALLVSRTSITTSGNNENGGANSLRSSVSVASPIMQPGVVLSPLQQPLSSPANCDQLPSV
eukprot:GDKJ01014659.1.p1 GENE.GDKJ01014659.1~~GDKJ01014659.1.p1  ORF type:complete len:1587 (-),score=548.04 GDKJ01014659.1:329-5089(-)